MAYQPAMAEPEPLIPWEMHLSGGALKANTL
jgi:hypothetical protein